MKTTQAWAWLVAGVLAAGLNAAYHDGGLVPVHRAVEKVTSQTSAVLALANAGSEQILFEAVSAREQAQLARLEANRARREAWLAAQTAHLNMVKGAFNLGAFQFVSPMCPRVQVSVPRIPQVRIPAPPMPPMRSIPTIQIEERNAGPA
jgi:hypothetical protein